MRDSFNGRSWLDSWVDDPWVKGSYAAFLPGQWTSFFGYMGRREGNVHFAGEHTSTYSQGYLNGGVETGLRAAREVIHATGRRGAPAVLTRVVRRGGPAERRSPEAAPWLPARAPSP